MIVNEFGDVISTSVRDEDVSEIRKAYALDRQAANYDEWSGLSYAVHPASLGHLSYRLLRYLYQTSSAIRPAVDSICRDISTKPWSLLHYDLKYHPYSEVADIYEFFKHPNMDGEKFHTVIYKYVHDLLVVGKGVIEKVRNPLGKLMELVPRDATLYTPHVNSYGFVIDYVEYKRDTTSLARYHKREDLIYEYFTPTSYCFGAAPIIETIVNEVALLMLCTKSLAWGFTRDEIPPGILHLGTIGNVALERAKASFEAAKGLEAQRKLRVVDNVDTVQWVQFTKSNRDQQVAELIPMIERVVFRNFGLSPVESAHADITRNVAQTSYQSSESKLTYPLMVQTSQMLDNDVIEEFDPNYRLVYEGTLGQNTKETADKVVTLVDSGIITDNEARIEMGYYPVEGGDNRSVKLGNERVPLDPKTGEPNYKDATIATRAGIPKSVPDNVQNMPGGGIPPPKGGGAIPPPKK